MTVIYYSPQNDLICDINIAYGIDPGEMEYYTPTSAPSPGSPTPAPQKWYDDRTWKSLPETGDDTNLPLYIAAALLALLMLWRMKRREKRT